MAARTRRPPGTSAPRTSTSKRGTTLIETIVVIAVFSLLALTITWLLIGGLRAWHRGQTRTVLRADARYAVDQIQADFRQNKSVTTPTTASQSLTLAFTRYANTIGNPDISITYTINTAAHTLTRQDSSGTTVIAENVVDNDPRPTGKKSYFAWEDFPNKTTMGIHLYLVEQASLGLTSSSSAFLETAEIHSSAYWLSNSTITSGVPGSTQQAQALINTPGLLADPRTGRTR